MANAVMAVKKEVVDVVANRVREFQQRGEINFPPNYSPENALKAAWLNLQEIKDKNGKPAIQVCTQESIMNALLSMVVQGLNPIKKQCYFIPYGTSMTLQRSYFGTIAVTKSVQPNIEDITADVVYQDDVFTYTKSRGKTIIKEHEQRLENIDNRKIVCAYATVIYKDGSEESLIMTMNQLKQAWKQSRMNPIDDKGNIKTGSTHDKFTEEMSKKTVINRLCKRLLNTTDDSNLVIRAFRQTDEELTEKQVQEEITLCANQETLDIENGRVIDKETGEVFDADFREMDNKAVSDIDDAGLAAEIAAEALSGVLF